MLGQSSTSARESAEKASEKLLSAEKRIKYLEGLRGEMKMENSSLKESVSVLEGQVATRDAEIGTLRRQMDSLRSSWDAELRQAVSNALRELHAKASGKMAAAKERLLVLKRDFINPCLASAEVVNPEADSALTSELIGIARLLRLSPLPSPLIEDGMKGSSLELLSAEVGVTAQAGSNLYSSVVDALLAEKRCEEVVGAGTSAEARQNEGGPTEVVEVPASLEGPVEVIEAPTSQEGVDEVAQGEQSFPSQEEGLPSLEGTLPPTTNEAGDVAERQREPEKTPSEVIPTPAEVQDGEQVVDPSAEVKTPSAKQTPSVEEEKNSSGQSNIWDQIVL